MLYLVPQPNHTTLQSLHALQTQSDDTLGGSQVLRPEERTRCGTAHQTGMDQHAHLVDQSPTKQGPGQRAATVHPHQLHMETLGQNLQSLLQVHPILTRHHG